MSSWFEVVSWLALALGFASALVIVADIVVRGNWQHMAIMNPVWPISALYLGPLALRAYFTRGRRMSLKWMHAHPRRSMPAGCIRRLATIRSGS